MFKWIRNILEKKAVETKALNIILGVSVFLILILSIEFGTRSLVYFVHGPSVAKTIWLLKYEPYLSYTAINPSKIGKEFPPKDDKYRILILGGSTAIQIPLDIVKEKFQEITNRKVEVFNFADGGYIFSQNLVSFVLYGIKLNPDLVISLDGANDMVFITKKMPPGVNEQSVYIKRSVERPFLNAFLCLFNKSMFVKSLFKLNERKNEVLLQKDKKIFNKMITYYIQSINSVAAIAKGCEAEYICVLQPYLYLRKTITEEEKDLHNPYFYRDEYLKNGFKRLDNVLSKEVFPSYVYYVSALDAFNNSDETCFWDNLHLNRKGNEILIDYIIKKAQEKGFYLNDQ